MSRHFDLLAPFYNRLMRPPDVGPLAKALGLPAAGWLLDVGGGTGRVSRLLAPWVGGVVVCDASQQMLARARLDGLDVVLGYAERLPFADGAFGRVLVVDALHHFRSQRLAAREFARVLAPGGRLLVSEPDITDPRVRLVALAERLAQMDSHFLPAERIAAMLAARGLTPRITHTDATSTWIIADKPEE